MQGNNLEKDEASSSLSSSQCLRQGAAAAWPICLGNFPVGLALGVLASQAELPAVLAGMVLYWLAGMF